jgi:hypothetical protein
LSLVNLKRAFLLGKRAQILLRNLDIPQRATQISPIVSFDLCILLLKAHALPEFTHGLSSVARGFPWNIEILVIFPEICVICNKAGLDVLSGIEKHLREANSSFENFVHVVKRVSVGYYALSCKDIETYKE